MEQLAETEMLWYVVKVQSNREKSIRDAILRKASKDGLSDCIGEILIPVEKTVDPKLGSKKTIETKLFPGYLIIQMRLTDESWLAVRGTSGVGDFTGAGGKPMPMPQQEIDKILHKSRPESAPAPAPTSKFAQGDRVKIVDGAFEGFEGQVCKTDDATGRVTVTIEIIGRATPVDLEHWQITQH